MKVLKSLFETKNIDQLILTILFLVFILFHIPIPQTISIFLSSTWGVVLVVLITIILIMRSNPILGVLSIFVAYTLISRAMQIYNVNYQGGLKNLTQYAPKQKTYPSPFTPTNQFPMTLEAELVQKIAPICPENAILQKATYHPFVENIYNSASI